MLLCLVFNLKNPLGELKCGYLSQADIKAKLSDSRDVYASLWRTVSVVSHFRTGWILVVKDGCMNFSSYSCSEASSFPLFPMKEKCWQRMFSLESFKIELKYFLNAEKWMWSAFEGIGIEDIVPGVNRRRVQRVERMVDGGSWVSISWAGPFLLGVDVYSVCSWKYVTFSLCND